MSYYSSSAYGGRSGKSLHRFLIFTISLQLWGTLSLSGKEAEHEQIA